MRRFSALALLCLFTLGPAACVTTTTASTTWTAPAQESWARPGRVQWVREVIQREQGDPVGGALAGAIIGGIIGGRGAAAVVGAAGGAAIGAAASQGSSETRTYEVMVGFQDGGYQVFVYGGYSPFRPGEPVVLTPQGLARAQ